MQVLHLSTCPSMPYIQPCANAVNSRVLAALQTKTISTTFLLQCRYSRPPSPPMRVSHKDSYVQQLNHKLNCRRDSSRRPSKVSNFKDIPELALCVETLAMDNPEVLAKHHHTETSHRRYPCRTYQNLSRHGVGKQVYCQASPGQLQLH